MTHSKFLALVSFLIFTSTIGLADDSRMGSAFKQYMEAPDNPVILRGDYFRATLVAYRDFAKELSRRAHGNDPKLSSQTPGAFDIQEYDISIDQDPTSFIVQFGAAARNPSHVVFGGGANYIIDRSSFAILKRTLLK
jgi:hypothetical protein